jgi:hypothetical protein
MRKPIVTMLLLSFLSSSFINVPKAPPEPRQTEVPVVPVRPSTQADNLHLAYQVARADGHQDPRILQGLILQESNAGLAKNYRVGGLDHGAKELYYGLAQIKVSTAMDVMRRFPGLWNEFEFQTRTKDELKAHLMLNNRFNLTVASKYLKMLKGDYGYTGRTLLNAYNQGPGGVRRVGEDWHYALGVEAKLAALKTNRRRT